MFIPASGHLGFAKPPAIARAAQWQSVGVVVLIALWTFAVRAPFAANFDNDEVFFSVVASRWLNGVFSRSMP
jgi:hypothetical protein